MASDPSALVALSLGGNVGDVVASFRHALARLAATPGVEIVAVSSVWRTKAWGKTDQPDFLNMAALLRARLSPREALALCLRIEKERGRERGERWGPRTLDIDVLTHGETRVDEEGLTLPHPRARERAFVLAPLAEIAPDLSLGARTARESLALADTTGVVLDPVATAALSA